MKLEQRHILLGVTGGIAAYKAAELARLLVKSGALVQVVMTQSAQQFIGPMTFQAITGRAPRSDLFDSAHEAAMGHIELARWADLIVVAPATANFISRLAHGGADDLLSTLCLASSAPLAACPAMNKQMWTDQSTGNNIEKLKARGISLWGPAQGSQACGETGPGRMLEAGEIFESICTHFNSGLLGGKNILVTAGPTYEAIDPVRFISNHSSGKMGFAITQALVEQGARVTLIAGPVALPTPAGVTRINIESALQMHDAVVQQVNSNDIFISAAAVADYRPVTTANDKIKKQQETIDIELVRNPDILARVAALENGPYTVGFAAETRDIEKHARSKLENKKLDMIAANQVGAEQGGFNSNENALLVITKNETITLPMQDKLPLARKLTEIIASKIN